MKASGGGGRGGGRTGGGAPAMTFDEFAARQGNFRFAGERIERLPNTSEGQRRRISQRNLREIQRSGRERETLRQRYNQLVEAGAIRLPSRIESLRRTARGNPENPSVQAARRLLRKQGKRW